MATCKTPNCEKEVICKGVCRSCYNKLYHREKRTKYYKQYRQDFVNNNNEMRFGTITVSWPTIKQEEDFKTFPRYNPRMLQGLTVNKIQKEVDKIFGYKGE